VLEGSVILGALACSLAMMFVCWLIYLKIKNPGIVDIFWSLTICAGGLFYFFNLDEVTGKHLVYLVLLLCWALRLSGYLFITRILPSHKDPRYQEISKGWKKGTTRGFFINYMFQGFLAFLLSLPFYFLFSQNNSDWGLVHWFGLALIVTGVINEALCDRSLSLYKKTRNSENPVCRNGWWRYSRHPHYFFDQMVWVGFFVSSLDIPWGWVSFLSPFTLILIMYLITAPLTEKISIRSKGEHYLRYQQETPMIFPDFVRWFRDLFST